MSRPSLVVVLPVFNEGANLARWWSEAGPFLPDGSVVRLVYDRDDDDTLPVAAELRAAGAPFEPLRNRGRGPRAAILTGLRSVRGGPVLVSMADLSDDLSTVPAMLAEYHGGAAIVVSSRYMPGGQQRGGPWLKRQLSRAAGVSLSAVGFPLRDATNSFRIYDAAFVAGLTLAEEGGFEIGLEIALAAWRQGLPISEVPGVWRDRVAGASRFRLAQWLPNYGRLWLRGLWFGVSGR